MNYLAHIYLSGNDEELLFGNFIADHVKGSVFVQFDLQVQMGIRLHRSIDSFTDAHAATEAGKKLLYPFTGKYAPVAMDIIMDHFLAAGWDHFHPLPLSDFTDDVYRILDAKTGTMPEKTRFMYGYMKRDNWLYNYSKVEGIEKALRGLSRRSSNPLLLANSVEALKKHYNELEQVFLNFFPALQVHVEEEIQRLRRKQ